jgi:hypothetical protein
MSDRAPSVMKCVLLLAVIQIGLWLFGLPKVMRLAGRARLRSSNDQTLVDATLQNIISATVLYPGRSQCLEQSVAAYILLRRRGFPVKLCIGVQPYPFAAHAWLNLDGMPLTESAEAVSRFVIMPTKAG